MLQSAEVILQANLEVSITLSNKSLWFLHVLYIVIIKKK